MRKVFVFILLLQIFNLSSAQDIEKVMKEFQNLMTNPTGTPYGNNPDAGKYYDIRGFKMYAEVYGQGQPLLLIHGNSGSINNFVYQIPYFSKKYKVVIADSRAQGKSIDNGDSLSYEMMADDYAALLDAMKIDSADVIGWSDGGINALLLAIRHPKKVKMLASTGANIVPDTSAVPQEILNTVLPTYNMLMKKANKNEKEKNAFKLFDLIINHPHIPISDLHKISCASLIMGGDHEIIKPEHTLLIAQNIPKSYLWIFPNSGHSTPIVYKDEFNKKIDEFFSTPYRVIKGEGRFF